MEASWPLYLTRKWIQKCYNPCNLNPVKGKKLDEFACDLVALAASASNGSLKSRKAQEDFANMDRMAALWVIRLYDLFFADLWMKIGWRIEQRNGVIWVRGEEHDIPATLKMLEKHLCRLN